MTINILQLLHISGFNVIVLKINLTVFCLFFYIILYCRKSVTFGNKDTSTRYLRLCKKYTPFLNGITCRVSAKPWLFVEA